MSGAGTTPDEALPSLSKAVLVDEILRLRAGIRRHRDADGHDLCWHQPGLWALLPESSATCPTIPAWPQFMRGCVRYRASLDRQLPDAPRSDEEFEG